MESRRAFYDWLVETIAIDGITEAVRDTEFDDLHYYRSGGIRLAYNTRIGSLAGMKDGILLEVGFDAVSPNAPYTISSWAYDFAADKVDVIDNRAIDVACYHPGYTFVEKLQTVSTKFRKQQEDGDFPANFMRHYYDIFRLLRAPPQFRSLSERTNMRSTKRRDFVGQTIPFLPKTKHFYRTTRTLERCLSEPTTSHVLSTTNPNRTLMK